MHQSFLNRKTKGHYSKVMVHLYLNLHLFFFCVSLLHLSYLFSDLHLDHDVVFSHQTVNKEQNNKVGFSRGLEIVFLLAQGQVNGENVLVLRKFYLSERIYKLLHKQYEM